MADRIVSFTYNSAYPDGTEVVWVGHAKLDSPPLSTISIGQAKDGIHEWLTNAYAECASDDLLINTLTVRDTRASGDPDPGEQSVRDISGSGNASGTPTLPRAMCIHASFRTSVPLRSARGGMFLPPIQEVNQLLTPADGVWDEAEERWTKALALMARLDAGHDFGLLGADGHASHIVFSQRRLNAGLSYYWDVSARVLDPRPHWLRSRLTSP